MAYQAGSKITASDLNSFLSTIRAIYGNGSGDRGYGQEFPALQNVTTDLAVMADHWGDLRSAIATVAAHQGTSIPALFTAPSVGDLIEAFPNLQAIVDTVDENRLNADSFSLTLQEGVHTITRTTNWKGTITATIDVAFADEDSARHFFNSGGRIGLHIEHPRDNSSMDDDFRDVCSGRVGVVQFGATATQRSGAAGQAKPIGYYSLSDAPQVIYDGTNIGGHVDPAYGGTDVTIAAARRAYSGHNGGNGATVRFIVTMTVPPLGDFDELSEGTRIVCDVLKATTRLTGIASPIFITAFALDGGAATEPPGEVTNLRIVNATSTTLSIEFTGAPGAVSHQYRIDQGEWTALTSNVLSGLTAETNYTIQVRGVNEAGAGPAATVQGRTNSYSAAPGAVTNLRIAAATANTLTIAFTPAPMASSHEYSLNGGTYQRLMSNTLTGLSPDRSYTIQVRGRNDFGVGPATSVTGRTDVAPPTLPGPVTDLMVSGTGATTLTLSFKDAPGATLHQYSLNDGAWMTLATNKVILGLRENTTYTVAVRGVNDVGFGPEARTVGKTTPALPGAVTNLRITSATSSSLTVAFTPASNADSHQYSLNNGNWQALTSNTIGGLSSGTNYTIRVRGVNAYGFGSPDTTSGTTQVDAPGAVTNLRVTGSTAYSLTIDFNPAPGATGHQYSVNGGAWMELTSRTISGLEQNTSYTIKVRGTNAAGVGPEATTAGTTDIALPGTVTDLRVVSAAPNSLTIDFGNAPRATSHQYSINNGTSWVTLASKTITGLAASTNYQILVRGVNASGTGPASSTSGRTTLGTVSGLRVTASSATTITITWDGDAAGATRHEMSVNGGTWTTITKPHKITGLDPSRTYTIAVRGVNQNEVGASVTVSGSTSQVTSGEQVYDTPGSYTFTVPPHARLTIRVIGGGGGGNGYPATGSPGAGGASVVAVPDGQLVAHGGGPGSWNLEGYGSPGGAGGGWSGPPGATGANGAKGGGGYIFNRDDSARSGAGNSGFPGGGGIPGFAFNVGNRWHIPGGGGGGGYVTKTYENEAIPPGTGLSITVGAGGAAFGSGSTAGFGGRVVISWE
mgnify:FL=1